MKRNEQGRRAFHRLGRHLLAILGAAIAGNMIFALNGGPFAGHASGAAMVARPVTVSRMSFRLDPTNPSRVDGVVFSVTAADGTHPDGVAVLVDASGPSRYACEAGAGGDWWRCDLPGLPLAGLSEIRVLAD